MPSAQTYHGQNKPAVDGICLGVSAGEVRQAIIILEWHDALDCILGQNFFSSLPKVLWLVGCEWSGKNNYFQDVNG